MGIGWQILWLACGVATIVAALRAGRSSRARYLGRAAVGVLFVIGGALLHVINLASGGDYAGFADPAHFAWVTHAWRAVVAPNQVLFIGLLVVFEAAVGVLSVSGGRRTQLGYLGVIGFYLPLWLFGWIETETRPRAGVARNFPIDGGLSSPAHRVGPGLDSPPSMAEITRYRAGRRSAIR